MERSSLTLTNGAKMRTANIIQEMFRFHLSLASIKRSVKRKAFTSSQKIMKNTLICIAKSSSALIAIRCLFKALWTQKRLDYFRSNSRNVLGKPIVKQNSKSRLFSEISGCSFFIIKSASIQLGMKKKAFKPILNWDGYRSTHSSSNRCYTKFRLKSCTCKTKP